MMCGAPSATQPATAETQEIADEVRMGPGQASRSQAHGDPAGRPRLAWSRSRVRAWWHLWLGAGTPRLVGRLRNPDWAGSAAAAVREDRPPLRKHAAGSEAG